MNFTLKTHPETRVSSSSRPKQKAFPPRLRLRALWIAAAYGGFGTLWIYSSDRALAVFSPNPELLLHYSVYKGIGFIAFTTLLLFALLRKTFGAIDDGYLSLRAKESLLAESEERLASIVRSATDAIVIIDDAQRIVLFNAAAEKMFGCGEAAARGQLIERFMPTSFDPDGELRLLLTGRRDNDERFPVEASISRVETGKGQFITVILRDISHRLNHEIEVERLRRLYAALSHVNQAIVRTPTRAVLFKKVCEVLVQHGEFRLAWIGWHDPETNRLCPVAECGEENDYVQSNKSHVNEWPEGMASSGTAFREGRAYICNDLLEDPATLPWRPEIVRRGIRAMAVMPIRVKNQVCGTLNVYASEAGFFQEQEIALLTEAVIDLSYALDNLARDEERKQAEAIARNERDFSDTMIESMPGILYFYDEEGRFLRWNKNFEIISGYSGAEISTMRPVDFFTAGERSMVETRVAEVFKQGESFLEASFLAKDGTTTPYFLTGRSVKLGGTNCLVGVGIDMTERKRAESALRQLQQQFAVVVENLREGLVIADLITEVTHWNPASLRLLGYERPDEGRRLVQEFPILFEISTLDGIVIPTDQWPMARLRRGEQLTSFEARVHRIGTDWERIFSYSGASVNYDGSKTLAFLSIRDITERKQAEKALRNAYDMLEVKVAERTGELQTALARAESADRIKSAFLATMSHELRTPLNSIIGFTGIILQGMAGPLNPEQAKQLGMVRGSARHLLELINDVLDLSKIEAGQLEVSAGPFDLLASIERVISSIKPMSDKKGLIISFAVDPDAKEMIGDRRRVEQILLNLLNNAIKFTERGSIQLTAEVVPDYRAIPEAASQRAVILRVSDTGSGIKPEDLMTLFLPFRQIDTGLARQHEGTGLGLAICRRLAGLMGGEISAISEWSKGSTFTVILPLHHIIQP